MRTLEGLCGWLQSRSVLPPDAHLLCYTDLDSWYRAGGETYQATLAIEWAVGRDRRSRSSSRVRLKAIVTLHGDLALQVWARRRRLLETNGVPVSHWFSYGSALIIEPYYPGNYRSVHPRPLLLGIARRLDALGFAPRNFMLDVLCDHRGSPYYVDFGEDLGEPEVSTKGVAVAQYHAEFGTGDDEC